MEIKTIELKNKDIIRLLPIEVTKLKKITNNIAINPVSEDKFKEIFGDWFEPVNFIKEVERGYIGVLIFKKVYISFDVPQDKLALIKTD